MVINKWDLTTEAVKAAAAMKLSTDAKRTAIVMTEKNA